MLLFILFSTLLVASLSINLPVIDISSLLNDPDGAAARRATVPLRGPNLFPVDDNGDVLLKEDVLEYMGLMRQTGSAIMRAITNSLGKNGASLGDYFMEDPTELFRIFSYPAPVEKGEDEEEDNVDDEVYGVGEHTDYGFLTILHQDSGGLQVKVREGGPVCSVDDL